MRLLPALLATLAMGCPTPSLPRDGGSSDGGRMRANDAGVCTQDLECAANEACFLSGGKGLCLVPGAGAPCASAALFCADARTLLECHLGSWREAPCRSGCVFNQGATTCDLHGALPGDPCPTAAEGRGLCTDGGTLECRDLTFVLTNSCRSCIEQSGTIICTP